MRHVFVTDVEGVRDGCRSRFWISVSGLRVNIWFHSQPTKGLLEISFKAEVNQLCVRKPTFLDVQSTEVLLNDKAVSFQKIDSYMIIEGLKQGDRLSIRYDLKELIENVPVNGRAFEVTWAGNTVMDIKPPGKIRPFYVNRKL